MAAVSGKVGDRGARAGVPTMFFHRLNLCCRCLIRWLRSFRQGCPKARLRCSRCPFAAGGMAAAVTGAGGHAAVVGLPGFGLLAAAEMGADLSRLAVIPNPGADPVEVAAVLMDGMDLVVLGLAGRCVPAGRARTGGPGPAAGLHPAGHRGQWQGASMRMDARVCGYEITTEPGRCTGGGLRADQRGAACRSGPGSAMTARVLAIWCMDWPAVAAAAAAGLPSTTPVAVTLANRVVACSAAAREAGVRRGLRRGRRRPAARRCIAATADPARDARFFENVIIAVDDVVPRAEVLRPGLLVLPVRGAARYFGTEQAAAERLIDAVAAAGAECQAGIADQLPTAVFAARAGRIVDPGRDAAFLSGLSIRRLAAEPSLSGPGRADLADLLWRMGVRTIGQFAALPRGRGLPFDADAVVAHRFARANRAVVRTGVTSPNLDAVLRCDPPIERVDAAAFAGRTLAATLHRAWRGRGRCTRLAIHAVTAGGYRRRADPGVALRRAADRTPPPTGCAGSSTAG